MKRFAAGVLTVVALGLMVWSAARRPTPVGIVTEDDNPAARLEGLLSSGATGDVPGYLSAFGGPLRRRLEREAAERGPSAFATDLRRSAETRKGHALLAAEPDGPGAVRIAVESVYLDRNERQTYRLEQGPDGKWHVTEVEPVRGRPPSARYGSLASEPEPEAPTGGP